LGGAEFDAFVLTRSAALCRFAYLLVGDRGLAEDVVQEALLKLHRRWKGPVAVEHPEAFVRRTIVTTWISVGRRRSSTERPAVLPEQLVDDTSQGFVERDLVWRLMAELVPRQRAVLVLRYYEALPDAEIAAVLDCPPGTVRSLAARAFAVLRAHPQLAHLRYTDITPPLTGLERT